MSHPRLATIGAAALVTSGTAFGLLAFMTTAAQAVPVSGVCTPADVNVVSQSADLTSVTVELNADAAASCTVSLHSYTTQGPTWPTSGTQTEVGFAEVALTSAPFNLMVATPTCYGQVDLAIGSQRFDGSDGTAPLYPNRVFGSSLITSWTGSEPGCGTSLRPGTPPVESSSPPVSSPSSSSSDPTSTTVGVVAPVTISPSPSPSSTVKGVQFTRPNSGSLPFTGAPVALELAEGAGLVGAGALLIVASRRRFRTRG